MTAAELRRLRRRLGLSQVQLAAKVGVAANTVARWERGEMEMQPAMDKLVRLALARHSGTKGTPMTDEDRRVGNELVIRDYLADAFAGARVANFEPPRHGGMAFRIDGSRAAPVWFTDEFLEDTRPSELGEQLRDWDVASRMKRLGGGKLLAIMNKGIETKEIAEF